jgi:5-methylcytosine-specific restriction endonuclease McrA
MNCIICDKQFSPSKFHPHAQTCSRKCSGRAEYLKHRESYMARAKEWIKSNPEKYKTYLKKTHANNPELYRKIWRLKQQRRTAAMLQLGGDGLQGQEWELILRDQDGRCFWCAESADLTIDHVIPVSRGGRHEVSNIVGACRRCNSSKGARHWPIESSRLMAIATGTVWQESGI